MIRLGRPLLSREVAALLFSLNSCMDLNKSLLITLTQERARHNHWIRTFFLIIQERRRKKETTSRQPTETPHKWGPGPSRDPRPSRQDTPRQQPSQRPQPSSEAD